MNRFFFDTRIPNWITQFLSFWVLLFAVSPYAHLPWGTGYRYLAYVAVPLALIAFFYNINNLVFLKKWLYYFFRLINPFLPFLIGFLFIRLYYFKSLFDPEINFNVICLTVIFNAVVFSLLACYRIKIKKQYFFTACALSGCLFITDVLYTAYQHGVSIWEVRPLVRPYATIYGRCLAIIGGLTIIGAFCCRPLSIKLKISFILIGILCFVTSIGVLVVRATLFVPFISLLCVMLLQRKIDKRKLFLAVGITTFLALLTLTQTPLGSRLERGYQETVSTILNENLLTVIEKTRHEKKLTAAEEKIKKDLNTSMGGRVAVLTLATDGKINYWTGTGLGKPKYFIDVKKLFSYSKDYLPHFHSDYVQCYVVGGIILLTSLVITEILLFFRALYSPILLYLFFSMISFGLIDLGFLDLKAFCCFVGAWMIVSYWNLPVAQTTWNKINYV